MQTALLMMLAAIATGCGASEVDAPQDAAPAGDAALDSPDPVDDPPAEDQDQDDPASTVERADPQEDPYAFSYQMGYEICEYDPQGLYDEAGSTDPADAADWYGDGLRDGPHRDGGVAGCLDGLRGAEARY
jgi:hypothetical protein